MKKRSYLVGILLLLFAAALAVTIYYTARLNGKVIEYRDLAAIFTAFIVSGSFIITTINTKLNADSNEAKLQFDRNKFGHDKKLLAFNLFKEYNSELMVAAKSRTFTVNELVMRSKNSRGGDAPIKV